MRNEMELINQFCEENRDNIVRDIKRLVAVPSPEEAPQPGMPFGPGPAAALEEGLKMAQEMGFETYNSENYIGWAELKGTTDKQIATITHLDVVPAGADWTSDPYQVIEKEGWLIGRGTSDDKGPSVICLYALKYLKDHNIPLKYNIRALFGANEETGMKDVDYYLEHYKAPDFCFSPDAAFPVCNGEKGIYNGILVSKVLEGNLIDFQGGVANNAIPNRASCLVKADFSALSERPGITLEQEDGAVRIRGWGKAGHAAGPAGTVNAIGLVVDYLLDNDLLTDGERGYFEYLRRLHHGTDGSGVGIAATDKAFDPLTIIGGVIYRKDGRYYQQVDCRYPTTITGEEIAENLEAASEGHATVENVMIAPPFYIGAENPAIKTLVDTYNEVSGTNEKPFTIGGGTYARHFPKAVSFGPGENKAKPAPSFVGGAHGPDEGVEIAQLMKALKIYILTLIRLQDVEL